MSLALIACIEMVEDYGAQKTNTTVLHRDDTPPADAGKLSASREGFPQKGRKTLVHGGGKASIIPPSPPFHDKN